MANISEAFIFSSLASATDISGITIDVCETLAGGVPVVYSGATLRKSTALGATPARSYVLYLPNITERTVVELHDNGNPAAVARLVLNPADGDEAKESTLLALLGTGDTAVDHNTGGADNLKFVDGDGAPIDNAVIIAYLKADYDAGNRSSVYVKGRSNTDTIGQWAYPIYLDSGNTYTIVFYKQGAFDVVTSEVTI